VEVLRLLAEGSFASFRVPGAMRYQYTYLLPPKLTLIGLAGAALGLADVDLVDLQTTLLVGVVLKELGGQAQDLWRYVKLKTGGTPELAVVTRELLYRPVYWIYYALLDGKSSGELSLDNLSESFGDPAYPLTLGRSDDMIVLKEITKVDLRMADRSVYYKNTVLPFSYREVKSELEPRLLSEREQVQLPQVIKIPSRYKYDKDGTRQVADYLKRTIVFGLGVRVVQGEPGWSDTDRNFYLL
jgi:CRISPR-associated protein Cas5t/CRISPR-associated protein Cas5h